jgi:hypothetical protein
VGDQPASVVGGVLAGGGPSWHSAVTDPLLVVVWMSACGCQCSIMFNKLQLDPEDVAPRTKAGGYKSTSLVSSLLHQACDSRPVTAVWTAECLAQVRLQLMLHSPGVICTVDDADWHLVGSCVRLLRPYLTDSTAMVTACSGRLDGEVVIATRTRRQGFPPG